MHTNKKHVNIVTLGCSKNIVDSEKIATQLQHGGYTISHNQDRDAFDTVIINTCGFIETAKEESINSIIEWTEEKKAKNINRLIVTGCLSQRYQQELSAEIPEVDAWFGTLDLGLLLHTMQTDYKQNLVGDRLLSTPSHYAYLKIAEGCNRTCSFCAIPLMRGKHISKPIEELVMETQGLAQRGVKEIMLIAQELTYYGLDLYKKRNLDVLLERLAHIEGIEWIRLHYAYPHKFPMEIISAMKQYSKICRYLDMPLQHASDNVLKSMKRQITRKEMSDLLANIRKQIPEIAIRTTMIVGYPGETQADFQELLDFVQEQQFDRLGVFKYSHEQDTTAFTLADDVNEHTKEERYNQVMEAQSLISLSNNESLVGKHLKAIVDKHEGEFYLARTERDSPEVDNEVTILNAPLLKEGDFVEVKIMKAFEYDLEAQFIKKY